MKFRIQVKTPGSKRVSTMLSSFKRPRETFLALTWGLVLTVVISACAETATVSTESVCRDALDNAIDATSWTAAVKACGEVKDSKGVLTDTGRSLQAQAYMGRAGVSLLGLLDSLSTSSSASGLSMMLSLFSINPTTEPNRFTDVSMAVTLMEGMACFADTSTVPCSDTDSFNILVASDVMITSMFVESLGMFACTQVEVDAKKCTAKEKTNGVSIPGITNAGLESLTDPSDFAAVTATFNKLYTSAGSYYRTPPLPWASTATVPVDLKNISTYVRANQKGVNSLGLDTDPNLASLKSLDFASSIDNGQCGYATTVNTASPTATDGTDATVAVEMFPRRLNTSDTTSYFHLIDDLQFVLLSQSGSSYAVDINKEWKGSFTLPSALVNPDHLKVACSGLADAASPGVFSKCIANSIVSTADFTTVTTLGGTAVDCGGSCATFPVLSSDGNILTEEVTADGATAKAELTAVLNQLYPIKNTADPSSATFDPTAGVPCIKGDGWVHNREYDFYLRSFGL